jgi:hypothetical protein
MVALLSLSESTAIICWYVAVFATLAFGTLFLISWLTEEFAQGCKWKKRKKILLILAIVGCAGEQLGTLTEFAISEHLQTISDNRLARLEEYSGRDLDAGQQAEITREWKRYAGRTILLSRVDESEAIHFADEIFGILSKAGFTVKQVPFPSGEFILGVQVAGSAKDPTMYAMSHSLNCLNVFTAPMPRCGLSGVMGVPAGSSLAESDCELSLDIGFAPLGDPWKKVTQIICNAGTFVPHR